MTTPEARIERLRELTETVRPYASFWGPHERDRVLLNLVLGSGYVVGLLKSLKVAVLDLHYEPNSKFSSHTHAEDEFVVVYGGHFMMDLAGDIKRLGVGDILHIPGGMIHDAWTEDEACDQVVITVPANPEFPDAG
jgi:quercetin dioxygenase-like cupin family protein